MTLLNRSLMSVDLGRGTRRFQRFVTLGGDEAERRAAAARRAASWTRTCSGRPCRRRSASSIRGC